MRGKCVLVSALAALVIAPALTVRADTVTILTEDFGSTGGWLDGYNDWTSGYYGTIAITTSTLLGSDPAADSANSSQLNAMNWNWKIVPEAWNDPTKLYTMTFQFAASHNDIEGGFGFCTGQVVDVNQYPIFGLSGPWWYYNGADNWAFISHGQNGQSSNDRWNGWHAVTTAGLVGKPLTAKIFVDQYLLASWGELTDGTITISTPKYSFSAFTGGQPMNLKGLFLYAQQKTVDPPPNHGLAVDDVTVTAGSPVGAVQGQITLEDYLGGDLSLSPVLIHLAPTNMGKEQTLTVTLGSNPGTFSTVAEAGTYDVTFSACKWLRTVVTGVVVPSQGVGTANVSLPNGDLNGDNHIGTPDFSILSGNFDKAGG